MNCVLFRFTQALFYTGNQSADLAAGWLFENQDTQDLDTPLEVSFLIIIIIIIIIIGNLQSAFGISVVKT